MNQTAAPSVLLLVPRPIAVALILGLATPAVADRRHAGGSLDMAARAAAEVDPAGGDRVLASLGTVDLRALYGRRLAYAAAVGFEVGAEAPAGFAYALRLEPVGGALRFGQRGWIGVVGGIGGSGVIDRVPIGLELPVTGFVAIDLGRWVRLSSRLRVAWLYGADGRAGGSRAVDAVDELDLEAGLALGERETRYGGTYSDSTYVGVFAREQLGQRIVGVSLAVAISGAGSF